MPGMLKFTLVLPTDDDRQAVKLLQDAINDLEVILMIVISPDTQWVEWADQLAAKGQVNSDGSFRRVVWIREPGQLVLECLAKCLEGKNPPETGVMVLNFHDSVCAVLQPSEIRPLTLEEAFLKGQL